MIKPEESGIQNTGGALNGEKSVTEISGKGFPVVSTIVCERCNLAVIFSGLHITDTKPDRVSCLTVKRENFSAARSLNAWQCAGKTGWRSDFL